MREIEQCATCLAWEYRHSNFSRPEGDRMTGWCRVLNRATQQGFYCKDFSSKAQQARDYLARIRGQSLT